MEENETLLKKILATFSKQEGLDDLLAMSAHRDGHKRENAVRRLGMLGNPIAIPKLIVRANDWVPQVKNAAKQSLERLLTPENAEAFVLSLPDLYHLQNCGRDDHEQLINNVTNFLLEQDNITYIKSAIKNDNPYIARIAVKLCIEHSLMTKQELVSETLSHHDIVIRSMASNLLRDFTGQVLESFLQKAIQDPFMPIRREAFQLYLRVIPEKGLEIAHKFLFDRHSSIREIAITRLLKHNIDVELILIDILLSANQSALKIKCALLDLAYIGAKQPIQLITKFTNNALPSIRKSCLQALVKLVGEEAKLYLLAGLKDESAAARQESSSPQKR